MYMLGLKNWEGAVVTFSGTTCDLAESSLNLRTFGLTSHILSSSHPLIFVTQT